MRHLNAVILLMLLAGAAVADADRQVRSKEMLLAYYDDPQNHATVTVHQYRTATIVEVCADVCDAFAAKAKVGDSTFWDAIFLFKAVISRSADDEQFGVKNSNAAKALLKDVVQSGVCRQDDDDRSTALCFMQSLSHRIGLEHAEVNYDEGNRCAVYRSFDSEQKAIRSKCTKVKQ